MVLTARTKKPYSFFYFIAGVIIASIGIVLAVYGYNKIDTAQRAHILDRAETVAKAIPIAEIKNLSGTPDDIYKPSYNSLKKILSDVKGVNSDIRFIYLMGQNASGTLFFYVDSEAASSPDYSPPGQLYQEATPPMYQTIKDGLSRSEGPSRDRWGVWISGYTSVVDENGRVVALLGMDTPAQEYILNTLAYAVIPILVSLIILIIIYFLQYLGQRESRYLDMKEELLSIASHEIRTPLLGIRWALEDIWRRSDSAMDEETKSTIHIVYENCLKLIKETNDLLSLTTLKEARKKIVKKEEVKLKEFFEDIKAILSLSAKGHQVSIKIDQSLGEEDIALFDRKNMHHAFFNLVSNAIKYSKPDTEITISYQKDKKDHIFKIADHGKGMELEDTRHIFEGYYRTKEAINSTEEGNGLGLYLTKKIIESHKGSIAVESKLGEGSTFTVKIPQ
jgi:signal transduction histidine kinase